MNLASIVFTVDELLALQQATATFTTLLEKIKTAAPDAWAATQGDFSDAVDAWNRAARGPVPSIDTPAVDLAIGTAKDEPPVGDGSVIHNDASTDAYVQVVAPHASPEVEAIVNAGAEPRDQQL